MERAAECILKQFRKDWSVTQKVLILCGPGNNGGDGLALARMLLQVGYETQIMLLHSGRLSSDCKTNKERLQTLFPQFITIQKSKFVPPNICSNTLIVDTLFGTGVSRPLEGVFADAIKWTNTLSNQVLSVDIPSGLQGEACIANADTPIIQANRTYTLQFPKLAFFFSENEKIVGKWQTIDIQLHPNAIRKTDSNFLFLEKSDIALKLKKRNRFSHKGNFGHTLIWAGSNGMAGAAVLATKGTLRSGVGLVSVHSDADNRIILQTAVPEAMFLTEMKSVKPFNAVAFGPGLGKSKETRMMLSKWLKKLHQPIVLDADALNIISENKELLHHIPPHSIVTPHPKEFERLFGKTKTSKARIERASKKAKELNIIIVLKGTYTCIAMPNGKLYFNSTGNPGMATGGMGDVLTGLIAGLLSQGYLPEDAALIGVFIHGIAAELAMEEQSEESLLPTDLLSFLGKSFQLLHSLKK